MNWNRFIIFAWGALLAFSVFKSALPVSWWFNAGAVRVASASTGECPVMDFDREINRPFYARWTVTIMRQAENGHWVTFQTFSGANDYRPENNLPADLDLCWWTWQDELSLPAGVYRVNTLWVVEPSSGGSREVRRTSNTFEVE